VIVNENTKWVIANFKETQMSDVYEGKPAEIVLDAIPGRTFKGKIESVSASTGAKFSLLPPDNATGNFVKITQRIPVKVVFTDSSLTHVKAGMSATVSVKK
jgi:membrane fusion protein (multidrug efflux system)